VGSELTIGSICFLVGVAGAFSLISTSPKRKSVKTRIKTSRGSIFYYIHKRILWFLLWERISFARAHSRASSGLVCYLHYRLLVRMTNKYDGTSAVFAAVLSLARVLFQWFPTFWTINHLQIPSWITREDDVKML
jgi:hypothetical protein